MALFTFPLQLTEFFDRLPIAARVFDAPASVDLAETGSGEILPADVGTSLWSGSFELDALTPEEAADVLPFVNLLKRSAASFFVCDPMRLYPRLEIFSSRRYCTVVQKLTRRDTSSLLASSRQSSTARSPRACRWSGFCGRICRRTGRHRSAPLVLGFKPVFNEVLLGPFKSI